MSCWDLLKVTAAAAQGLVQLLLPFVVAFREAGMMACCSSHSSSSSSRSIEMTTGVPEVPPVDAAAAAGDDVAGLCLGGSGLAASRSMGMTRGVAKVPPATIDARDVVLLVGFVRRRLGVGVWSSVMELEAVVVGPATIMTSDLSTSSNVRDSIIFKHCRTNSRLFDDDDDDDESKR